MRTSGIPSHYTAPASGKTEPFPIVPQETGGICCFIRLQSHIFVHRFLKGIRHIIQIFFSERQGRQEMDHCRIVDGVVGLDPVDIHQIGVDGTRLLVSDR